MRKLIAVLLITMPLIGNAKVIGWTKNQGEGKIVLTDIFCEHGENPNKSLIAYTSSPNKPEALFGCYQIDLVADQIFIIWNDSSKVYVYDGDAITFPDQ